MYLQSRLPDVSPVAPITGTKQMTITAPYVSPYLALRARSEAEARAAIERTRAEFDEMARWRRSPAGIAFKARAELFRAAEDARHDERFVRALIVDVAGKV